MIEIKTPKIDSISMPEYANINQEFIVRVFVTEATITINPYELFVGDLYAEEV